MLLISLNILFITPFFFLAHSPDNSFLGFVVESHLAPGEILTGKKPKAVVYGKDIAMWNVKEHMYF